MEAEKSHNPQSATCRIEKASGVIQSECDGLIIGGPMVYHLVWVWQPKNEEQWCLGQGKMAISAQVERKKTDPSSTFLAYSGHKGLADGHLHRWRPYLRSLLAQMLISSGNPFADTPQNNNLPGRWVSLSLLKLTHKITIIGSGRGRKNKTNQEKYV